MEVFAQYLSAIENPENRAKIEEVLGFIHNKYPNLLPKIAWNQPMFTDHGTFIIGFSVSKQHMSVTPELAGMVHFSEDIAKSGYNQSKMLFQIPWSGTVDYTLLERMIEFNIADKAGCETFWRK